MGTLGETINQLLVRPLIIPTQGPQLLSSGAHSAEATLQVPHLRRITIRFPDATQQGSGQKFKMFQKERGQLWSALKEFLNSAKLKSLQLEDLRDFGDGRDDGEGCEGDGCSCCEEDGNNFALMNREGPYFDAFTKDLNENLGFEGVKEASLVRRRWGREVYRATETWTAAGSHLVWRSDAKGKQ
jgi:hypothetical protein